MSMFDLVRQEDVDLRLPSRGVALPASEQRRVNRAEAQAIAVENSRRNVQIARLANLGEVSQLALWTVSAVSRAAEVEAAKLPEERARLDAIADVTGAKALNLVVEF